MKEQMRYQSKADFYVGLLELLRNTSRNRPTRKAVRVPY